jgi:mono/diheme cytochrome c family protein
MPRTTTFVAVMCATLWPLGTAWGATPAEQRRELSRATTSLRVAERMAKAKRHDEAAKAVSEAQEALKSAADGLDDRLTRTFERASEQLEKVHGELTAAGVKLPPLAQITRTKASPKPSLDGNGGGGDGRVSFVQHIVPILNNRCGGCHVRGDQGEVSFANYNNIVEGVPSGRFIEVGSGMESAIVDVIVSGQMPPNGNEVPPEELRALVMWINQGAAFDGDDPAKALADLAKGTGEAKPASEAAPPKATGPPIPMATGNETVSFALDIAPLLIESCADCHGAGNSSAGLSVATFAQLWEGGNAGSAIKPGDAEGSLLVEKLRGTAMDGVRMPQNRPAWSNDKIELVSKWINEGAKFDGASAMEPLARVAGIAMAERSTPEQLSAERENKAGAVWHLAIPDERASAVTSEHFLAIGNLPESQMEKLLTEAERQADEVQKLLEASDQPFNKARVTIYLFDHRIDYREFGTMVERRSLPDDLRGHAEYDIVHPYVAIVADDDSQVEMPCLLAEQLATLRIADRSQDRLPDWFCEGAGKAISARIHPRGAVVKKWREELPAAVAAAKPPEAFMTGKLPPATTSLLSFGFVDGLMQKQANFDRLVAAASTTSDFDAACQEVFKKSGKELAELWAASQRGRR